MSAPILTFFNNKGGVGKTSLIYHLAWTFADTGKIVLIADIDPQSNLTAAFLDEDMLDDLWSHPKPGSTIYQAVKPLIEVSDIAKPLLHRVSPNLHLIPGDVALSGFEETLSAEWPGSMGDNNLYRPMRILSAFWQVLRLGAAEVSADIILLDIGPNLGAINRSALIATDFVAIPLGADLFSLQGLKNLGPILRSWRSLWKKRLDNWQSSPGASEHPDFQLPAGIMQPIGYLCQQHIARLNRPIDAYDKWVKRIPAVYREAVLGEPSPYQRTGAPFQDRIWHDLSAAISSLQSDPNCLATIRHYRSLIPMGQEHRKPIFRLTPADGAIGSHAGAVQDAHKDFLNLATKILASIESTPSP